MTTTAIPFAPALQGAALCLLTATMATLPSGSQAAASVPMEVRVAVTPAACTPVLSSNGEANYGVMNASILKPGQITSLPAMTLVFSVNCDAAAKFSLAILDNRTGSVVPGIVATGSGNGALNDDYNFGLGASADRNTGGYTISFISGSYSGDYQAAQLMSSPDGQVWTNATTTVASKRLRYAWGSSAGSTDAYRTLSAGISVRPYINKPENLSRGNDIILNGSATLELHYL